MKLVDLYPTKGFFHPGETAQLQAEIFSETPVSGSLLINYFRLDKQIAAQKLPLQLQAGCQQVEVRWELPASPRQGYGVEAHLLDVQGREYDQASTALNVLTTWTEFPRCGFLADFSPERANAETALAELAKFHINVLQFYDWQYRHHELLPPQESYIDPLGRHLSLQTVRDLLDVAHVHGMASLAYLAIYAAGLDFWRERPQWALYNEQRIPLTFFDFLGLMDPTPGKPWAAHLLAECGRVLQGLPFDGLQVDQYGEPKQAFNANGNPVDLPQAFRIFLEELNLLYPNAALHFNAVGNWPIETVAAAPTAANYIEVWPPATRYADLAEIVRYARRLSPGKPVIIALYLPASQPANNLLSDAVILAAGGTRIELGEDARLLSDPYFPKHQPLPPDLYAALRRYASFAVRYAWLLGPQAVEAKDITVVAPPGVWAFPRRNQDWLAIPLVNTSGLANPSWDQPHPWPEPIERVYLHLTGIKNISEICWASPDLVGPGMAPLGWRAERDSIQVIVPLIETFGLLGIRLGPADFDLTE